MTKGSSQHHHPHPLSSANVDHILRIDSAGYGHRPVVVEVEVQLPVAETEFLRFEEKRVVQEREGVEDVEAELPNIM